MASPQLLIGRTHQPGAYYTITTVVRGRRPVLASNNAAEAVIEQFHRAQHEGMVHSLAWVVMPDHVHWLFRLQAARLGTCLQRFKSRSARGVNALFGLRDALWQAGYYDHRLRDDEDLRTQARYILANPIRSGLAQAFGEYRHAWTIWGTEID